MDHALSLDDSWNRDITAIDGGADDVIILSSDTEDEPTRSGAIVSLFGCGRIVNCVETLSKPPRDLEDNTMEDTTQMAENGPSAITQSAPENIMDEMMMSNEEDLMYTQRSNRKRARSLEDARIGLGEILKLLIIERTRR